MWCRLATLFLLAVAGAVLGAVQNPAVTRGSAAVNGTTLDYDMTGSGPHVVLIGGGGTLDRRAWDNQVAALSPQYTVLRYDVRGIGGSARPVGPFSHGEDLHTLLQSLSFLPAYVAGLSFGAGIAVDLALDYPEAVRGLVLAAPGLSSDKDQNLDGPLALADFVRAEDLEPVVDAMVANPISTLQGRSTERCSIFSRDEPALEHGLTLPEHVSYSTHEDGSGSQCPRLSASTAEGARRHGRRFDVLLRTAGNRESVGTTQPARTARCDSRAAGGHARSSARGRSPGGAGAALMALHAGCGEPQFRTATTDNPLQ